MPQREPLSTENWEYRLDEQHRNRLLLQAERDRLARLARAQRPRASVRLPDFRPLLGTFARRLRHGMLWAFNRLALVRLVRTRRRNYIKRA